MNNKNADYGGVPVAASRQSLYQRFPIDFLVERNVHLGSGRVIFAEGFPLDSSLGPQFKGPEDDKALTLSCYR